MNQDLIRLFAVAAISVVGVAVGVVSSPGFFPLNKEDFAPNRKEKFCTNRYSFNGRISTGFGSKQAHHIEQAWLTKNPNGSYDVNKYEISPASYYDRHYFKHRGVAIARGLPFEDAIEKLKETENQYLALSKRHPKAFLGVEKVRHHFSCQSVRPRHPGFAAIFDRTFSWAPR